MMKATPGASVPDPPLSPSAPRQSPASRSGSAARHSTWRARPHAPERVAMLPSLAELVGFVVMALLIAAGIASLLRIGTPSPTEPFWESASDAAAASVRTCAAAASLPAMARRLDTSAAAARGSRAIRDLGCCHRASAPDLRCPGSALRRAAAIFGIASVLFSAPFVLNVPQPSDRVCRLHSGRCSSLPSANWSLVPTGSLGVLFDQEYGALPFAPVLILAFVGLAGMLLDPSSQGARDGIALS